MEILNLFPENFPVLLLFFLICGFIILFVLIFDGMLVVLRAAFHEMYNEMLRIFNFKCSGRVVLLSDPKLYKINNLLYYNSRLYTGRVVDTFNVNELQKVECYRRGVLHGFSRKWNAYDDLLEKKFFIKGEKKPLLKKCTP